MVGKRKRVYSEAFIGVGAKYQPNEIPKCKKQVNLLEYPDCSKIQSNPDLLVPKQQARYFKWAKQNWPDKQSRFREDQALQFFTLLCRQVKPDLLLDQMHNFKQLLSDFCSNVNKIQKLNPEEHKFKIRKLELIN
jgi:hypothetical protein